VLGGELGGVLGGALGRRPGEVAVAALNKAANTKKRLKFIIVQ
jgi:hypothetical protein